MSAQASSGAGGDERKHEKASKCERCGNRHEGPCWPRCGTCGKTHKGACRYANPVPSVGAGIAARERSQVSLTALQNAQQLGYQQAYNEIRSSGMGPGMVPGLGGPFFGSVGSFGGPYAGPYGGFAGVGGYGGPGGFGAVGTPGWGYQAPGPFGQIYGGFPMPPVVQSTAASRGGRKQGAAAGHMAQARRGGPKDGQKPRSKEEPKTKKDQKGALAVKDGGVSKTASKNARARANKKARQRMEKAKEEEEEDKEALSGPADLELLRLMADKEPAPANNETMENIAPPTGNDIDSLAFFHAESLIEDAIANPKGFHFPQDRARVEAMAKCLELYGQERVLGLSETAAVNKTSIIWEAFQQDLFHDLLADPVTESPLPESGNKEDDL